MQIMTVLFNEAWKTATSNSKECSEYLNLEKQHGSEKGGCITCIILSTYVFVIYSLMFMCFLGSVYLQKCKKKSKPKMFKY